MRWPVGLTRSPIGLDVGVAWIKAAQLSGRWPGYRVAAAACYPRARRDESLSPEEIGGLRQGLARDGFVGRRVVAAAPSKLLFTGMLELPPRQKETPLEDIARMEMARLNRRDPGGFEMACWDLPSSARSSQGTQVMAVASATEETDRFLDLFETSGFEVVALDVLPWALARVCALCDPAQSRGGRAMVLDLGSGAARLTVLHDGVVAYYRQMPDAGLHALTQALMERLELDESAASRLVCLTGLSPGFGAGSNSGSGVVGDTETTGEVSSLAAWGAAGNHIIADHFDALAEELRNAFSFVVHRYPSAKVDHLHLVGGGALTAGLPEWLAAILETKVTCISAQSLPQGLGGGQIDNAPLLAAAIGLASYGGGGGG